ncbi:MAG: ABC transporter substrate-binding protein [Clostridia bacterium]|jgi:peptide/nickel transport system substrate-binding protein|nr:ABC transporter substrate-binding protein [Clostridia bacterium]
MKKRLAAFCICLLVFSLVMTACGGKQESPAPAPTPAPAPAAPQTDIVIALQGEPSTLDTQYADDGNMRMVTWQVFEPLVKLDAATLKHVPVLAASFTNIDDITWEFKIRPGVKFHDGSAFTAEDAAFSINRIISPDFQSQIMSDFDTIKEAVAVDAETVRVTTVQPDPLFLNRLPKLDMVSRAFTEAHSAEELTTLANGTGPYKLDGWNRSIDIKISAFDGYWGKAPAIQTALFRWIEESNTRLNALKRNEVNFAVNMYPEYVAELPKVFTQPSTESYFFRFNLLDGVMKDKNLRLAMQYAVDRDAIAEELFLGYAAPTTGQWDRAGAFGFTPELEAYPYDVEKAKELLAAAGYKGEKIQLVSEKGRWLKDGEVTEAVAAMLTEAGFNIETRFVSWNEWLDTLFDKTKSPDLIFCSNSNEFLDVDRNFWSSVHSSGSQSTVASKEIDAMIEEARYEMDKTKRQALYDELNKYLYDNPVNLNIIIANELHGGSPNLNWDMRKDNRLYLSEMSFK